MFFLNCFFKILKMEQLLTYGALWTTLGKLIGIRIKTKSHQSSHLLPVLYSRSTRVQWSRQPWTTLCPCSLPAWWALSPSRWTICPWALQEVWVPARCAPMEPPTLHKHPNTSLSSCHAPDERSSKLIRIMILSSRWSTAVSFMSSRGSGFSPLDSAFNKTKNIFTLLCISFRGSLNNYINQTCKWFILITFWLRSVCAFLSISILDLNAQWSRYLLSTMPTWTFVGGLKHWGRMHDVADPKPMTVI